MPLLRFSATRTPFGRSAFTWKSVWSPITASTPWTLSARSTSGPVGWSSVPEVAPRCPIATTVPMPSARSLAASALTAAVELATWNGPSAPGAVDDVGRQVGEVGQRDQLGAQVVLAAVEVVVAEPVGAEAHLVHQLDRGRVPEEAGDRRGRADRVACRHGRGAVGGLGPVLVEPRLEEGGAADGEGRVGRATPGEVVGRLGQRHELAVVVADVEDRHLLELPGLRQELVEDPASGVPRTGDAEQERQRRGDVDGAHARQRVLVAHAWARREEGAVHVDVVGQVDQVRQIAVLAEELRRRDRLAGCGRVELVWRPRDHDHVPAARGVQRVAAVDVAQLLLLHDPGDDPLAGAGRVAQLLESADDLVPDGLVVAG